MAIINEKNGYEQTIEQLKSAKTPKELLAELSKPFPEDAITRVSATASGRGRELTGIKRAYLIERLNEVVGVGGWQISEPEFVTSEIKWGQGTGWQCICKYWLEIKGLGKSFGLGDGIAKRLGDAMKGAESGAFKRAAACFGLGLSAYKGTIDEDFSEQPEPRELIQNKTANLSQPPRGEVPQDMVAAIIQDGEQTRQKDEFDF